MNFPDDDGNPLEDDFLGLASMGVGGSEYQDMFNFSSESPIHENLQPPLHDTGEGLEDMFGYADSSLTIPMATDYGPEPPALSPAHSYQPYDHMSMNNTINAQGYNSFEQPTAVINGEYTHPVVEDSPMLRENTPQHGYYANELPSTSTHQQKTTYAPTPTTSRAAPAAQPSRNPPPPRQRPIQPKSSSSRKRGNDQSQNGTAAANQQSVVRVSMNDNEQIGALLAEIQNLQRQEKEHGIDNSLRLKELEAMLLGIFSKTGAVPGMPTQPAVIEAPPPPRSHQRQSRPPQNHHPPQQQRSQQIHVQPQHSQYDQPTSPYQPQMIVVSQPNTSQGNGYQEYHHQVVHQSPVPPQQQQQQRPPQHLYRVHTIPQHAQPSTAYQQQQQQVPTTVYVQPQHMQPQMNQPTVGQYVRQQQQQHAQVRQAPVQQQHVMLQQQPVVSMPQQHIQMQHPQHVAPPILTPQVRVVRPPPRQPKAEVERDCAERAAVRRKRVHDFLAGMERQLEQPDTERPFSDLSDVLKRLLPYHQYLERDLKEEHVEFIDSNLMRANLNNNERVKYLQRRTRKLFFDEAARDEIKEEQNLLLALDAEYEKRKLEEERTYVNDFNRGEFVSTSRIIPAVLSRDDKTVPRPTPSANPPKFVSQYDYTPFVEAIRHVSPCKSPYIMSPASSIRSPSPMKSPTFHSPRLRVRSTNSTSSTQNEPPVVPPFPVAAVAPMAPERTPRKTPPAKKEEKPKVARVKVEEEPVRPPMVQPVREQALKKTKETPKKAEPKILIKEIKREPEPSPSKSPMKVVKPFKIKIKEEAPPVVEAAAPVVPNCVDVAPNRMPAKKAFLSRVRNAMPPALRSPPAQMAKPTKPSTNGGMESDGSCSPELGLDDFSSVPSTPVEPKKEMSLPSPLKKLVPLPPPLPKKPVVKEVKKDAVAEIPQTKIKVKLGPPPKDVRPVGRATRSAVIKEESTPRRAFKREEQENLADVDTSMTDASAVKRPPIKLKLKLKLGGGDVLVVNGKEEERDDNENVLKEKEAKRLKKEKRRRKREEHAKKREERLLQAEAGSPKEDIVVIPAEGLKLKFKFGGGGRSRTATPTLPVAVAPVADPTRPSTSTAAAVVNGTAAESDAAPPPPRKVPKLKIRIGPSEPKVKAAVAPITPSATAAAAAPAVRNNGPLPPVVIRPPPVAAGSAQGALPLVNFSDQSDSDGERMRSTDETLRSWGMGLTLQQPLPTPPLLPFSHP